MLRANRAVHKNCATASGTPDITCPPDLFPVVITFESNLFISATYIECFLVFHRIFFTVYSNHTITPYICLLYTSIRDIVQYTFLEPGYNLDNKDAVLEPSYMCEALGIQGRLDYMQRDMSSFIEMKSGKADEFSIQGKVEPNIRLL